MRIHIRILGSALVWLVMFLAVFSANGQTSEVVGLMTFNIRYANTSDGSDRWDNRKEALASFIRDENPAICGLQEALHGQVKYLDGQLQDYSFTGVGRADGKEQGEYSAILFDTTVVRLDTSGTFWLSESGDTASVGWDASMERICTWGVFTLKKSGRQFMVYNAHLDHRGKQSRQESAKLIVSKARRHQDLFSDQSVIMGDFNCEEDSAPYSTVTKDYKDSRGLSQDKTGSAGTWNGFDLQTQPKRRIDYIFLTGSISVQSHEHCMDKTSSGRYLSDHLPVKAVVTF